MMRDALVELARVRALAKSGEARRLRLEAALSLGEIASAVGVSTSTVYRWEAGERQPRGDGAVRYLEALEALEEAESGDLSRRADQIAAASVLVEQGRAMLTELSV